jgi:hypothetical protein
MKRNLSLLLLTLFACGSLFAQRNLKAPQGYQKPTKVATASKFQKLVTGLEEGNGNATVPPANSFFTEQLFGTTTYDLQSNAATPTLIHNWGNGVVSGVWTMSLTGSEIAGFADRGTGYNKTDASGAPGPAPTARLEPVRTGFSRYCVTDAGIEFVCSHQGLTATTYAIYTCRKAASATSWTFATIPTTTPNGGLWSRTAAGGTNGNTIHVIYFTTPTAFGGVTVDGLDGNIRYCRSTDGGATWDIVDGALPGLNDTNWGAGISTEGYAIDASGDVVAITLFNFTGDCVMYKSEDNGTTWAAPRIVHNFPLPNSWDFDDGYTFDDIASEYNPDIFPDSLAILTSDETGNVLVDESGNVHVAFGTCFIQDPDTTQDNSLNWYPGSNLGIVYWNDLMDDNAGTICGYSPDLNGDGVWGYDDSELYAYDGYGFVTMSTGPTLGLNTEDNQVYVAYNANHEILRNADNFHFKQPFINRSAPGDYATWEEPNAVLDFSIVSDTDIVKFSEYYFASMAKNVGDHAHILYQQDFTLGLNLIIAGNQEGESNNIGYIAYPKALSVDAKEPIVNVDLSVSPNPASTQATVRFQMEKGADLRFEVYDAMGKLVQSRSTFAPAGPVAVDVNTAALTNGLYIVRMQAGNAVGQVKLMVAK